MKTSVFTGFPRPDHLPWDEYQGAGFYRVFVGLNDEDDDRRGLSANKEDMADTFEFRWGKRSPEYLERGMDQALLHGFGGRTVLMPWLRPTSPWLNSTANALMPFTDHDAFGSLLGDLERGWRDVIEPGLTHAQAIERYFVPNFCEKGVSLGITCYAGPLDAAVALLEHVDYVIPQCYTPSWWKAAHLQPGTAHTRFGKIWLDLLGDAKYLAMGVGGYSQGRPGVTPIQAIRRAYAACYALGIPEVVIWSWPSMSRSMRREVARLNKHYSQLGLAASDAA